MGKQMSNPNPKPARATHPLKILIEELKARDWTAEEFSSRSGLSKEQLQRQPFRIDQEFAEGFAKAFGTSVEFWLNLQCNYDNWRPVSFVREIQVCDQVYDVTRIED